MRSETTPAPFGNDLGHAESGSRSAFEAGTSRRNETSTPNVARIQRAPVVGRDAIEDELVAGRNLVEPGKRNPGVREQMHRVPGLVAKTAPDDHDRGDDDRDEQNVPTVAVIMPG